MPRRICQPCGKKLPPDAHPSRKYHEGCRPVKGKGGTVRTLRSVAPDEKPEPPAPKKPPTLIEAIEAGNYLEILKAQRREMVRDVRDEKGPAKAAMHRQIALLSKEIASLEVEAAEEAAEDAEVEDEPFDYEAL